MGEGVITLKSPVPEEVLLSIVKKLSAKYPEAIWEIKNDFRITCIVPKDDIFILFSDFNGLLEEYYSKDI